MTISHCSARAALTYSQTNSIDREIKGAPGAEVREAFTPAFDAQSDQSQAVSGDAGFRRLLSRRCGSNNEDRFKLEVNY